jgi:hypothetical protein
MDHEQWLEQHDRMLADHDRKMAELREAHERTERFHKRTERLLRLAIRAGIQAKAEIDDAITKLAAAQLVTEERLQRLERLFEQRYGGNGGPGKVGS